MTNDDLGAFERLRAAAVRQRQRASIYDAIGEAQRATDCRALADFQEDQARRLRGSTTPGGDHRRAT